MFDWVRGLHTPPWVVGLVRGLMEAVLMGGLVAAAIWVSEDERMIGLVPVALLVIRWLEGIVDQIDKGTVRQP